MQNNVTGEEKCPMSSSPRAAVAVVSTSEASRFNHLVEGRFEQLFNNQQSLWMDNNKLMREFFEFMKNKN